MGTTQRKTAKGGKIRSSSELAMDLWKSDGIWGFFYGAEGQIFNASAKQGLTIMMKERLQFMTFNILMPGAFTLRRSVILLKGQDPPSLP